MAEKRTFSIKHNATVYSFVVDSRYTQLENIGTGAYGVVCSAMDTKLGRKVAIKKIANPFDVLMTAKRTYRELKVLKHFERHDNIISILDIMAPPEDLKDFRDIYVVLDLMESDLHHIIHSDQPLSDEHNKYFLYQILRGLKYIHSANVLHRDLKPSNLLINSNCELKIGDFGMARGLSTSPEEHSAFMTEYVATRWYRAPELMMSLSEYTFSIDMWSVGCIFAEMLGRKQLFPGKNYISQLKLILGVVGTPPKDFVSRIGSERVKTFLNGLPSRDRVPLSELYPGGSSEALNLLDSLLQLDPAARLSATDALSHKYFTSYHSIDDEPICPVKFNFDFERTLITKESLQKATLDLIQEYHKDRRPIPSTEVVHDKLKEKLKRHQDNGTAAVPRGEHIIVVSSLVDTHMYTHTHNTCAYPALMIKDVAAFFSYSAEVMHAS